MKVKKILAGIDFQQDTQRVLAYAAYFSRMTGASLHILHVIDYLVTPPVYIASYIDEERKAAEKKFSILEKQLMDGSISAETEVIVGRLHESFETVLKKTGADMLILGFVEHALRRSSSEKLIKSIQKPMLVVRGERASFEKASDIAIRKILCPSDFSDASKKALIVAKNIRDLLGAEVFFLTIYPDYLIKKLRSPKEREMLKQDLYERSREKIDALLGEMNIQAAGIIRGGEPSREIVSFAGENDIDLIVMGARGLGLIKGLLIGSVTDTVLKTSRCPVLVIH